MQKGHRLNFDCQSCRKAVSFSLFDIANNQLRVACPECGKNYLFDDEQLIDQLQKFEALCRQIKESEAILGNTSIGVDIQEHKIKVPFKILLTRLTSQLDLVIGEKQIPISFRFEPLSELAEQSH